MNSSEPAAKWTLLKIRLIEKFPQLNEKDLWYDYGQKEVMMMKLQVKIGLSRGSLNQLLSELAVI